jgi:hypothetical protein
MGTPLRLVKGLANGGGLFLEANGGGRRQGRQGRFRGAKTHGGGFVVCQRDARGCGSAADQGEAHVCSNGPTADEQIAERSAKHPIPLTAT